MNIYRAIFHARCPVNGARIQYNWTLSTEAVVPVEKINDALDKIRLGFHEHIADHLHSDFGGKQTLIAEHHGVTIETRRSVAGSNRNFLDQTAGGMAGTPGY